MLGSSCWLGTVLGLLDRERPGGGNFVVVRVLARNQSIACMLDHCGVVALAPACWEAVVGLALCWVYWTVRDQEAAILSWYVLACNQSIAACCCLVVSSWRRWRPKRRKVQVGLRSLSWKQKLNCNRHQLITGRVLSIKNYRFRGNFWFGR